MSSELGDDTWSVSAKKAFVISLVQPARLEATAIHSFHPAHAYTIFGDDEQIFGYQDLKINLNFNANDMRPNLQVCYNKKFETTGETEATDIEGILKDHLPAVAFQKKKDFITSIQNVRTDWTPPGKLAETFTSGDATYEVWKGSLDDPAVKQLVNRIQIFVPLLIEGGTYIPTDEPDADRWTVFFLYQKKPVPGEPDRASYVFNGYSTVYRFFLIQALPTPPASPSKHESSNGGSFTSKLEDLALDKEEFDLSQLPCRTRISQFIVLPPFQGKGLGLRLYNTIFQEYLRHPQTVEITVEDPNEAFDDMRDVADLHFLRQQPAFNALHINTSIQIPGKNGVAPRDIVDRAAAEAVRRQAKIAPRQFARVLEMHLMSKLPDAVRPGIAAPEDEEAAKGKGKGKGKARATPEQEHEYRLWQLMAKQRIYRHNKDALGELEIPERVVKLNETVASVAFDFARLLLKAERYEKEVGAANRSENESGSGNGSGNRSGNGNGKRKADGEEGEELPGVAAKKQKV